MKTVGEWKPQESLGHTLKKVWDNESGSYVYELRETIRIYGHAVGEHRPFFRRPYNERVNGEPIVSSLSRGSGDRAWAERIAAHYGIAIEGDVEGES